MSKYRPMIYPPAAAASDPAHRTDCGNFTPRTGHTNGENLCAHCPGWRIWHEPFREQQRIRRLEDKFHGLHALFCEALTDESLRTCWLAAADRYGWIGHPSPLLPTLEHDPYRGNARVSSGWNRKPRLGFPPLLLFGKATEHDESLAAEFGAAYLGPRPGGMLAVFVSLEPRPLYREEQRWADLLAGYGAEVHQWTRDLAAPFRRLSSIDLSEVIR